VEVAAGERLLAWSPVVGGRWVAGTRDALYLPDARLAWEEIEAADWEHDLGLLRVSEVGQWGRPRVEHALTLDDTTPTETDRLLQLVRERVTASVLLVRHVPITGKRGVRVVGRRAPSGLTPVRWVYEYDAGIDPEDPVVQAAAAAALAMAKDDAGVG
jgi:hypothetical protein